MITGQDGAGTIDQVGAGVPPSRVGERVWVYEAYLGRAFGTLAEYVVVPARNAVRLPDSVDVDTGAGLGVPALTAHRCLFMDGSIQGKTVLVQGGGGGVGHAAIQLASWAGARVIATVSRATQEAAAKEAGAHRSSSTASRRTSWRSCAKATGGRGVDRIVEVAFDREHPGRCRDAGRGRRDRHLLAGPVPQVPIPFFGLMRASQTVHFVLVYTMGDHAHDVAIRDVTACLEAGAYKTHVGARFPLAQAAEAHEAQDSGAVVGKILVDVGA